MDVCSVYGKYHTFDVPIEDAPHARRCACGTAQVYHPPTGRGVEFDDVLIDAADLRALVEGYRSMAFGPHSNWNPRDVGELLDRVTALLD